MRPREFWGCRLGVCAGLGFWGFCWHELGLDWVAMDCGSCWGVFVWALCGADSFFFGAMVFPPHFFSSFLFSSCFWGLRGSEPWGCLWLLLSFGFHFLFSADIETFSVH